MAKAKKATKAKPKRAKARPVAKKSKAKPVRAKATTKTAKRPIAKKKTPAKKPVAKKKSPVVAKKKKKPAKKQVAVAKPKVAAKPPKAAPAKKAAPPKKPAAAKEPAAKPPTLPELESLTLETTVLASPDRVYAAWLDSAEHSAFTGGEAILDPVVGGKHSAWSGYVEGYFLSLEPGHRIDMTWRTTEFDEADPDSHVVVTLSPDGGGTRIVVEHTDLPPGGAQKYGTGWREFYFVTMRRYFEGEDPREIDTLPPEPELTPSEPLPSHEIEADAERPAAEYTIERDPIEPDLHGDDGPSGDRNESA